MKDSRKNKSDLEKLIALSSDRMQKIYVERFESLFFLLERSNEWKKKYEYYQHPRDVNENSIIVSET